MRSLFKFIIIIRPTVTFLVCLKIFFNNCQLQLKSSKYKVKKAILFLPNRSNDNVCFATSHIEKTTLHFKIKKFFLLQ